MKIRKVKNAVGLVGNIVADMNATGVNDVPNTSTIKRYVDSKTIGEGSTVVYADTAPVGTIRLFGREDLPEGWLPCNGAAYLKTEYASLYEAINNTFNKTDDDPRYFRVPDLSGNVPVGYGGDGEFSLGNTGGEKEHTLTIDEMPSHAHNLQWDKEGAVGSGNGTLMKNGNTSTSYVYSTGSRGNNQPHNNMPPYVVVKYAIKAVDSTPTHGTIIDSMIGESTINAPSVNAVKNYVDKKQTYSTDEIVVGTYLGKPLYRKVITGNLSMSEIQHGLSNFILRNCYGIFYNSNSGKYFPVPSTRPLYPEYEVGLIVTSTVVQLERAANVQQSYMTIEIVLEYTKTTD